MLVKAADVGLAYGLVETGNALAIILAPLAAGFLYKTNPEAVYIVSLLALAITLTLYALVSARTFLPGLNCASRRAVMPGNPKE